MLSTHQASSRHRSPSGVLDKRNIKQPEGMRGGHWDGRRGAAGLDPVQAGAEVALGHLTAPHLQGSD